MRKVLIFLIALSAAFSMFGAGEETPYSLLNKGRRIESCWHILIGTERAKDSYLSTAAFSGTTLGLEGEWSKMLPYESLRAGMAFDAGFSSASMLNARHTERTLDMDFHLGWRLYRRWLPGNAWRIDFGGRIGASGGLLYNTSNGNNPVSARADVDISAAVTVMKEFQIGKIRFSLTDKLTMPVAGIFFSPQYGESYYEIYIGNHSGLVHFGYPGNRFIINNTFCVGYNVGKVMIEAGYSLCYHSINVCNLSTKILRNSFVAGVRF